MTASAAKTDVPKLLRLGSIALFAGSLALPAYSIGCGGAFLGIFAFLLGPVDLLAFHPFWLANPLLLGSWLMLGKQSRLPALAFAVAAGAAASAFWFGENKVVIAGASCPSTYVVLSGYFVWLASIGTQLLAAALAHLSNKNSLPTGQVDGERI